MASCCCCCSSTEDDDETDARRLWLRDDEDAEDDDDRLLVEDRLLLRLCPDDRRSCAERYASRAKSSRLVMVADLLVVEVRVEPLLPPSGDKSVRVRSPTD